MPVMRVEFYKGDEGRLCGWVATPPKRRPFQGTTMAASRDLPHDLTQFLIERALDIRDGFWGLLANGGSFASVPGRRPTRAGRALVRAHQAALMTVEGVVNGHYYAWKRGAGTPVAAALDATYAGWLALANGDRLVLEWPVHRLPGESAQRGTGMHQAHPAHGLRRQLR
ncbi:MAG TPA: hypothetical protein VJU87_09765 [Gemmatimonadaceae bacterium]|nr:hypothetical protein [Gemmatimonadaceae bacterium]